MGVSDTLRHVIARDPVIAACVLLSAIGVGLPLIVPPLRNAFSTAEQIPPPKLSQVVEGMTGKSHKVKE
ncbi:unnamed protein product [Sphagnum troendelagicum]|uniref:Uncharacterized protein n=1 Tax=Sphagnum troendelagicum TaxID=128251 RepID=A0ABP0T9B0_9BRYO